MSQMLSDYQNFQLDSTTAAAVGTVANLDRYKTIWFTLATLTSETVSVVPSYDGVNFASAALRPIDCNTGAVFASTNLANGTYRIEACAFKALKFTKSAASDTVVVTGAARCP